MASGQLSLFCWSVGVNADTYKTNLNNVFALISRRTVDDRNWIIERGPVAGIWIIGV